VTLETDIINILKREGAARPSQIREKLQPQSQYKKKYVDNRSFDVIISRSLNKLKEKGIVHKDDRGHQEVYYSLKEDAKHKIEKTLFEDEITSSISTGKLAKATVSKATIQQKVYKMQLDRINRYLRSSLVYQRLRIKTDEAQFFLKKMAEDFSCKPVVEGFDITILHSKQKSIVELTEEDLLKLLDKEEEGNLVRIMFNMRSRLIWPDAHEPRAYDRKGLPISDRRLGELWIILHCKPSPRPSKRELRSSAWQFEKKYFVEWLHQFKGVTCDLEVLDYVCPWSIKDMEKLSLQQLKEVQRLTTLYFEFSKKDHEYDRIYREAWK